jgi:hypothetical protein
MLVAIPYYLTTVRNHHGILVVVLGANATLTALVPPIPSPASPAKDISLHPSDEPMPPLKPTTKQHTCDIVI